jgi:predicted outer membrane repeat protein
VNSAWDPSEIGDEWMPDSLGGAIYLDEGDLHANKCRFSNNSARNELQDDDDRGGAIYLNAGSRLDMIDSKLERNRSEHGGAIASVGTCEITLTRCDLDENIASMDGGALNMKNGALLTDQSCNYIENQADRNGGAMHGVKSRIDMSDATFEDNVANENPAARFESARSIQIKDTLVMSNWCDTPSAAMAIHADLNVWEPGVIVNSTFSSNQGSGLHVQMERDHQTFLLDNGYFSGNVGLGGAAFFGGQATIETTRFYYNTCDANNHAGGLLFSSENGRISDTEFRGNHSRWAGGLYLVEDRAAHVFDCEFNHNTAEFSGGGAAIANNGSLIERCTFTNNGAGRGGGIYCYHSEVLPEGGGPTVRDCTFQSNNAGSDGGGICNSGITDMMVSTCEFRSNIAANGGGIANQLWGQMTISGSDIRENQAGVGGGLWTEDESATDLQNTVICSNVVNQVTGLFNDLGGNTIADQCPVLNPADLDGNGLVDGSDLAKLLGNWGPCTGVNCVADVNGDGTVDGGDLSILLGSWN